MFRVVRKIQKFCNKFPGEKRFGYYRFLPFFFIFGAGLEYTMIHWKPNGHNFYKTYIRRHVHEDAMWELRVLGEIDEGTDIPM